MQESDHNYYPLVCIHQIAKSTAVLKLALKHLIKISISTAIKINTSFSFL